MDDGRIRVDANQRASLRFPNFTAKFDTVQAAVEHWHKLAPKDRTHAALVLQDGALFQPPEIPLLQIDLGKSSLRPGASFLKRTNRRQRA
jgi:hypothetical protein